MKNLITTILVCVSLLSLNCEGGSPIPAEGDQYDISMFAIGLRVYFSLALPSADGKALFHHPAWRGVIEPVTTEVDFIVENWRFNRLPFNDYLVLDYAGWKFMDEPTFKVTEARKDHDYFRAYDLMNIEYIVKGLPQQLPRYLADWLAHIYLILPPGIFSDYDTKERMKLAFSSGQIYDADFVFAYNTWGDYSFALCLGFDPVKESHIVNIEIARIAGNNSGNIMN